MKKTAKSNKKVIQNQVPVFKKLRNMRSPEDEYYTNPSWPSKEIDGVPFIYVVKNINIQDNPKLIRKDSLEAVKK